jgi:AcrR family transcriptional regulator
MVAAVSKSNALPAASGRVALVLAAERLFAERGLDGVSLRQINEAAGQRNASAAHYHFGSREGVVRAVFEHRMAAVDARRRAVIESLHREGRMSDVRALIAAWIRPLAAELVPRPEGNHYVRFLDQTRRAWTPLPSDIAHGLDTGWRQADAALAQLLRYLPASLARLRLDVVTQSSIAALAQLEAQVARGSVAPEAVEQHIENLIDMSVGALTAPVSGDTLGAERSGATATLPEPGRRATLPPSAGSDHGQQPHLSHRRHRR